MAEVHGTDFRSRGITHQLNVMPNDNNTGWVLAARSFSGEALVNLPQSEAIQLAEMLLAGPGEIEYECAEHEVVSGVCIKCLL